MDYEYCWKELKSAFTFTEKYGENFQQSMAQAMISEMNKIEEKCVAKEAPAKAEQATGFGHLPPSTI